MSNNAELQLSEKLSQLGSYVNTLNTSGEEWIPFAVKSLAIGFYYDIVTMNLIDYQGSLFVGKEVLRFEIIDDFLWVFYTDGSSQNLGDVKGDKGDQGDPGRGITSVTQPSGPSTAQVNYTSGLPDTIALPSGQDGRGITNAQITGVDLVLTFDQAPSPVNVGRVVGQDGANGDRYATTSTTTITVPNHNDVVIMTVGTGLAYTPQQTVIVANDGIAYFTATVNSYNSGTGSISLTCIKKHGSGTFSTWTVNLTGAPGTAGDNGWSPILAVVTDGTRRVLQVTDWTGGTGTKPVTGLYIGASGLTADISLAVDIRGATGATGNGIATITQPDGPSSILVTYTNGSTQSLTLPNALNNPNIAPWRDDFIVLLTAQWTPSTSSGTTPVVATPTDTQESGALQYGVAAVNSTSTIVRVNAQYSLTANMTMQCVVRINALPDSTNDYTFVMSAWSGTPTDPSRWVSQIGIRIVRSGGNVFWQAICRNSTESIVNDTVPMTANTTYVLQWSKVGSVVTFYVDGRLIATISTNVPTGLVNVIYRLWKIAGAGSVTSQQYMHYENMSRTSLLPYANIG